MLDRSDFRWAWFFSVWATWFVLSTLTSAEGPADPHVKVELISEQDAIVPGKEFCLGVRFDLEDEWHTYWVNPGDSGEPPRIEWALPAGFRPGPIQWPYPERLSSALFADYGYEHQVLLIVAVRPPPGLKEGEGHTIAARVHYLVCRDVCIPEQTRLELTLPVTSRAGSRSDVQFEAARRRLPQPAPDRWKISAASLADEFTLNLIIGKLAAAPQFYPLEEEQIENAAPQTTTTIAGGFRLHLKKSRHLLKPVSRLTGVLVVGAGKAYLVDVAVSQPSSKVQVQSINK